MWTKPYTSFRVLAWTGFINIQLVVAYIDLNKLFKVNYKVENHYIIVDAIVIEELAKSHIHSYLR